MASQPESRVKVRFFNKLRAACPGVFFDKIQQRGKRNSLDVYICWASKFVAVELKRDKKEKPKKGQLEKARQIERAGGLTFVVHDENLDQVVQEIRRLDVESS